MWHGRWSLGLLAASTRWVLAVATKAKPGHRGRALLPPIIQVGSPFAEHLHTLPRVLDAGTDPVHFGGSWKFAARGQSPAIAPSVSWLPRHAQKAHSLRRQYEVRCG